jgi:hypothetical protein
MSAVKRIRGYRYELGFKEDGGITSVGLFRGQNLIRDYLYSEGLITSERSSSLKLQMYSGAYEMFEWLYCPPVGYGTFYFTAKGNKKIQQYVDHIKNTLKEWGVEVIRKTTTISLYDTVYDDEHQFALKEA